QFERDSLDRIRLVFRVSPPENRFDVVLKKRDRRGALPWEIESGSEEIANRDLEAAFIQPPGEQTLRFARQELGDSKGRPQWQPAKRGGCGSKCCGAAGGRINPLGPGHMLKDLALIALIPPPAVVGQKGDFVTSGESPQNVVRANLAAGINWNQLARFDPQDFHRLFTKLPLNWPLLSRPLKAARRRSTFRRRKSAAARFQN